MTFDYKEAHINYLMQSFGEWIVEKRYDEMRITKEVIADDKKHIIAKERHRRQLRDIAMKEEVKKYGKANDTMP